MQHNGWDRALKVTADETGLVGHAGAVLLRKAADQAGLTGQLSGALRKTGTSPLLDRGVVLVSMAAAIALGARGLPETAFPRTHRRCCGCHRRRPRTGVHRLALLTVLADRHLNPGGVLGNPGDLGTAPDVRGPYSDGQLQRFPRCRR
jgi:hypothetical protein